jgi:hypothetical protein
MAPPSWNDSALKSTLTARIIIDLVLTIFLLCRISPSENPDLFSNRFVV